MFNRPQSPGCMALTGHYRHELKYQITYADYLALRQRLCPVMQADPHTGPDGRYQIRSIYYDNYRDKALREKVDGIQKREKFRIRWYNDDLSFLTLEKKIKHNNLCMKVDAPITKEEFLQILTAPGSWMLQHREPLVQELYCKIQSQQLQPRVVVSYTREPYIYAAGNVRVTFDSQIRTTMYHPLNTVAAAREITRICDISATDTPQDTILEVKYDAFLPDLIADLLQSESLRQQAFSKYGACRRFG